MNNIRTEFLPHNLFVNSIDLYLENDPHLSSLENQKYIQQPSLVHEIPFRIPGVYILTGARQVGKSTLIKLFIKELLLKKTCSPDQVFYLPCDIIRSFQELINEIGHFFNRCQRDKFFYLFIDEVTYVKDWDRVIKYFADLGHFRQGAVLITGSDSVVLQEGMKRFPGRRGTEGKTDFHYYPLSFSQYIQLVEPSLWPMIKEVHEAGAVYLKEPLEKHMQGIHAVFPTDRMGELYSFFNQYMVTGGFLTALNAFGMHGRIDDYVYNTYIQWVIGDFLKKNKKEHLLKEILISLSERLGKQVSYQNITAATSIQSHTTTQDYLQVLTHMDVVFVLEALREDKLRAAPKKLKKVHFSDPFIANALICWAREIHNYWDFAEKQFFQESQLKTEILEGVLASLYRREFKTFYIKAETEVDLCLITGKTFLPIEIKDSLHLKGNHLKQILKYKTGLIGYKGMQMGTFEHLHVLPLPILALFI
jgi:predicted AAA+ superfamily ATPase